MRLTKEHIGMKVRWSFWKRDNITPEYTTFVGHHPYDEEILICVNDDGTLRKWEQGDDWELYEEPKPEKKKKLLAPAIYRRFRSGNVEYILTSQCFVSYDDVCAFIQELNDNLTLVRVELVSWPAIPNKDGFYEVEE